MITIINDLPPHVAGFRATGKITEDDYFNIINPAVASIKEKHGRVSYLLLIETSLNNYSAGAWIQDVLLGFKYLSNWNKLAIVTEKKNIKEFTDFFGVFIPPKTKGFMINDWEAAKAWVSE